MSNRNNLSQRADEIVAFIEKNPSDTGRKGHDVSNQPRVPKGHGDKSGEWTRVGAAAASEQSSDRKPNAQSETPSWPRPYNMCDYGYLGDSCKGWVRGFLNDKPQHYMPTPEDLDRLSDEQKEFYARYYESWANMTGVWSLLQGAKGLYRGIPRWLIGRAGKEAAKDAPTLRNIAKAYRGAIKNPKLP